MAYAIIAGFPAQFGVYASAVGSIVGPMFASSRFLILGPTNATAVLVMSAFLTNPGIANRVSMLGLLVLLVGVFLFIGSLIKASRVVQYISRTVITGYVTAAACLIIANQIHTSLGFSLQGASTFFDVLAQTLAYLKNIHAPSLMISLLTVVVWLVLKKRFSTLPHIALTILVVSAASYLLKMSHPGFAVACIDPVPFGQLPFRFPQFNWADVNLLASSALAIALLITLEGASIGKSLAAREGDRLDINQQLLSQGAANIACSFFSALPASGSLTRSMLNYESGARTPLASMFSGMMLAVTILMLGPALGFIPKPALAVLIISVGLSLINRQHIQIALKSTGSDAAVFSATLLAGLLFPLVFAVYLGIGVSLALFLGKVSTPELTEYTFNEEGNLCELQDKRGRPSPHISIIHVEGSLFFGAADLFYNQIRRVCADENLKVVILRLKNAHHLDATSVMALEELTKYIRETGRHIIVSGAMKDVYRVLRDSGLIRVLGKENIFLGSTRNPNISTRNALLRAQEFLGGQQADVKIYYDPTQQKKA